MAQNSKIEWTEATWNPVTGCTKVSTGCENCYAELLAKRLRAMGQRNYRNGFLLTCHDHLLSKPLHMKKPQTIFVNSMSDLFHPDVAKDFILQVFQTMNRATWHTFQVLTKRSERLLALSPYLGWTPNIWMGVTVENSDYKYRIDHLRQTRAQTKFISFEPLLGGIDSPDFQGIDWVIVGGESGAKARPIHEDWVIEIRDACIAKKIPFFFKQWGGRNKKLNGRLLEGRAWDEIPSRS